MLTLINCSDEQIDKIYRKHFKYFNPRVQFIASHDGFSFITIRHSFSGRLSEYRFYSKKSQKYNYEKDDVCYYSLTIGDISYRIDKIKHKQLKEKLIKIARKAEIDFWKGHTI